MAMARSDETDLLIPLHEGAQETPPWRVFLSRLEQRVRAGSAAIITQIGDRIVQHRPTSAEAVDELDPWLAGLRRGRVYAAAERGDEQAGLGRVVRAEEPEGASAWVVVERKGRDFSAADGALLAALAPHLAVALRTYVMLERARHKEVASGAALARTGLGFATLARDGRVIAASDEALARAGERLAPVRSEAGALIAAFCQAPAAPVAVRLATGVALLVAGRGDAAAMALFLSERGGDAETQAGVLRDLYGLAMSEARLAVAVARGASLAEAAVALGLTIETARNYSKRAFAKMRARGQADLTRIVLGSVAGLA